MIPHQNPSSKTVKPCSEILSGVLDQDLISSLLSTLITVAIYRLDQTFILTSSLCSPFFYNVSKTDQQYSLCILDCGLVTIGDRVLFGPGVSIFAATHETDVTSRRKGVEYAKEVTIGNDCWIGGSTVIMPGVTIGNGCTIGAGSVVTKDIPPFSVAIGSPARVVKKVEPVPDVEQE
jgi:acetyltransferase-like isoleucine patch superfamily enzyme